MSGHMVFVIVIVHAVGAGWFGVGAWRAMADKRNKGGATAVRAVVVTGLFALLWPLILLATPWVTREKGE